MTQLMWPQSPRRGQNVDLWCARPHDISGGDLQRYRALLTPEERQAVEQFHRPEDRRDRLISKVFIRTVLSSYADVPAAEWRFGQGQNGKPAIDAPAGCRGLRFNLSHTRGLIACVVATDREVGVDAECVDRAGDVIDIAVRYFADHESSTLLALPRHDQTRRFFELWTLKEAYAKARGLGLSIPLDAVTFQFGDPHGHPTVRFGSSVCDDASHWQFTLTWLDDTHVVATATTHQADVDAALNFTPLERSIPARRSFNAESTRAVTFATRSERNGL